MFEILLFYVLKFGWWRPYWIFKWPISFQNMFFTTNMSLSPQKNIKNMYYTLILQEIRNCWNCSLSSGGHLGFWALKSYAHHFKKYMGAKIKVYTLEKLKQVRNEPILQTVTGLQKMTQLHVVSCVMITLESMYFFYLVHFLILTYSAL